MTRLLLVRHGATKFNQNQIFMGHTDVGLSARGVIQVNRLRDYIAGENIHVVYVSDLRRTVKTAEILTAGHETETLLCPELREMNYGDCEGLSFGQIGQRFPDVAAKCINFSLALDFPGGESFTALIKRSISFIKRLKTLSPESTALIVSHNGPLKVLICRFLGLNMKYWQRFHLDTASLTIVYYQPHQPVLTHLNDTSFLRDL